MPKPRSTDLTATNSAAAVARNNLILSLAAIGLVIVLALVQLALPGNWPKVLRVSVAFLAYSTLLLSLAGRTTRASLPFYIFAIAAGAAELCSGWLRPDWRVSDTVTMPLVAALLFGGFHWFGLRVWGGRLISGLVGRSVP